MLEMVTRSGPIMGHGMSDMLERVDIRKRRPDCVLGIWNRLLILTVLTEHHADMHHSCLRNDELETYTYPPFGKWRCSPTNRSSTFERVNVPNGYRWSNSPRGFMVTSGAFLFCISLSRGAADAPNGLSDAIFVIALRAS
jgi:hypothetical protein